MNGFFDTPRGMSHDDMLQAELERQGNLSAQLRKQGICTHGWIQGTPGKEGPATCLHCGQVFKTTREAFEIGHELLRP